MVFNKMIVLAVLAVLAISVQADNGQITDWCPPCKRLIDDFTPGLKTTKVQEIYDQTCNDIYLEDEDFNKKCQGFYDNLFSGIREALNEGQSAEQICTSMGACPSNSQQARQKFSSFRQLHAKFQRDFAGKLLF
ncbi:hypothetical protein M3Y97_01067900 [Aphelenchoides bicaudatus]|nr:hypothetical protein M3Y97_01067900 [Aphelenchoides bicaudatus]